HPVGGRKIEHGQMTNADQRTGSLLGVPVWTPRTLPGGPGRCNAHPVQWQEPPPVAGYSRTVSKVENQAMRRAAVLGSPIRHSLSPVLHEAAYQALDLRGWHYGKIECDEAGLPGLVASMGPEWAGLSLTMPLKRVALEVADQVSPLAGAVGAANTLVFGAAEGWRADNTDVAGIVLALREAGLDRGEQAGILGAGGTAQAALAAVCALGHQAPSVVGRRPALSGEVRE